MEGQQKNNERRTLFLILPLIAVLCFLLWYFHSAYLYRAPQYRRFVSENGIWDMSGFDFETGSAHARGECEYIPGELLTPEEFSVREHEARTGWAKENPVNTIRLQILMPDDGLYLLADSSASYSSAIYINGELRQTLGKPALTAADTVPGQTFQFFEVRPVDGVIEIVIQTANFVHRENSGHSGWRIGRPEFMKQYIAVETDLYAFKMGLFLTLFLVHGLLFLILRSYPANLYFSLLCLTWGLRISVTGAKIISTWFPRLPWEVMFRTEYTAAPVAALLMLQIIGRVFPGLLPKKLIRGGAGLFAAFAGCYLFAPPLLMSWLMVAFEIIYTLMIALIIVSMAVKLPRRIRAGSMQTEHWAMLSGLTLFLFAVVHDALFYNNIYLLGLNVPLNDLALMIFTMFQMISMFYATMRQVAAAKEAEQQSRIEAETLRQAGKMKEEFLGNLSHELQMPLTVVSGFTQLTDKMLNHEQPDTTKMHDNLRRVLEEADRMNDLVVQLLDITAIDSGTFQMLMEPMDMEYLIRRVETSHFPILDGGSIGLNSEPGKGTTAFFTIPIRNREV